MGLLGLACICSTLVAIDGPLLQKATHVISAPIVNQTHPLNVSILPELPAGWMGGYIESPRPATQFNDTIPSSNNGSIPNKIMSFTNGWTMAFIGAPWLRQVPMSGFIDGCPKGCRAKVRAPALATTSCTSYQIPVDYREPASYESVTSGRHAAPLDRLGFIIDVSLVPGDEDEGEWINLVTGSARTTHCAGTLNYTACSLRSAVGEYEVMIRDNVVTLENAATPTIVALANNTRMNRGWDPVDQWHNSTLGGIVEMANSKWDDAAAFYTTRGKVTVITLGSKSSGYMEHSWDDNRCISFLDPRKDVMEDLNRLMFTSGYTYGAGNTYLYPSTYFESLIDPGLEVNTTVTGHIHGDQTIYHTNLRWFFAAAAVEVFCIALILPTYMGWWRLGRPVSFSPLEIAKVRQVKVL